MTITLYQDKSFAGRSLAIARDHRSLKDTTLGNHPSSLLMDAADDAILLFGKEDWKGGVMYFRGVRKMSSLGQLSAGGELFKGNSVTSVRVTPFRVRLNVNIVTSGGRMPGGRSSHESVEGAFTKAMLLANEMFDAQKAMIRMEIARFCCRENPRKFDLTTLETARFPADWKMKGEVDVVACNSFDNGNIGLAKFPYWGKVMIVAFADRSISEMARTLAHELGHYLGLTHTSGAGQAANIMAQSGAGLPIDESVLYPEQIEEMQTKLARNLTRSGDRLA